MRPQVPRKNIKQKLLFTIKYISFNLTVAKLGRKKFKKIDKIKRQRIRIL